MSEDLDAKASELARLLSLQEYSFVNSLASRGNTIEMQRVIDNYSDAITKSSIRYALKNALRNAQKDSILFLMEYIDIDSTEYFMDFLSEDVEKLTPKHFEVIDTLYGIVPEFLDIVYLIKKRDRKSAQKELIQYLEVIKVRERLDKGIAKTDLGQDRGNVVKI